MDNSLTMYMKTADGKNLWLSVTNDNPPVLKLRGGIDDPEIIEQSLRSLVETAITLMKKG